MSYCENCKAKVKGDWKICPLCQTPLQDDVVGTDEKEPKEHSKQQSSFINVPLRYNREKALKSFYRVSILLVFLYFAVQLFYPFRFFGLEYVLFGLLITWTLIVILIQKRKNLAKAMVYILLFISIISLYFDYSNGWKGWSITFVIPILSMSSLLAIFIGIQSIELKLSDYILYLQLVALFGIVPLLFLIMGWVGHPLPSILSVVLSILMFIGVFIRYRTLVISEFKKRMHL